MGWALEWTPGMSSEQDQLGAGAALVFQAGPLLLGSYVLVEETGSKHKIMSDRHKCWEQNRTGLSESE